MAQQIKDLALSLLWHRFDTWPGYFLVPWAWSKKKKNAGEQDGRDSPPEPPEGTKPADILILDF